MKDKKEVSVKPIDNVSNEEIEQLEKTIEVLQEKVKELVMKNGFSKKLKMKAALEL